MNRKLYIRKALTMGLVITTILTYSMVALANSEKLTGELIFNETDGSIVTVNGEIAKRGHSVFSSSLIETSANTSAVVQIENLGSLKLDPKTTLDISFNENGISAKLLTGKVMVLNAANSVNVLTQQGKFTKLHAGEYAVAGKAQDDDDDDDDTKRIVWAVIIGGAAAAIIYGATRDNDPPPVISSNAI